MAATPSRRPRSPAPPAPPGRRGQARRPPTLGAWSASPCAPSSPSPAGGRGDQSMLALPRHPRSNGSWSSMVVPRTLLRTAKTGAVAQLGNLTTAYAASTLDLAAARHQHRRQRRPPIGDADSLANARRRQAPAIAVRPARAAGRRRVYPSCATRACRRHRRIGWRGRYPSTGHSSNADARSATITSINSPLPSQRHANWARCSPPPAASACRLDSRARPSPAC